jgi:tetratricopeptide (TPR) repeat protein
MVHRNSGLPEVIETKQQRAAGDWPHVYQNHLDQRLDYSLAYLRVSSPAMVRKHIRSFLTLLQEARRYSWLTQKTLQFIAALHPLPVRLGLGRLWEPELLYALAHISNKDAILRFDYHCDLGDVYSFNGQFDKAIAQAKQVLTSSKATSLQRARAVRLLFTCYRSTGQSQAAIRLVDRMKPRFLAHQPAQQIPARTAQAWQCFNQCELELLRERGEIERAVRLVEDMIWLDKRENMPDRSLTASLYTHRSTLLWVLGKYQASAADLNLAIELYRQDEDAFNAESLQSNLGLVYLMMGDLDRAQHALQSAIGFYRRSGSEQLLTYDIGNLGLVYFARGEVDLALQLTNEHIEHAQKLNFISEYQRGLRNLGTVLYYFDKHEQSIEALETCHAYYTDRGSRSAYWLDLVWMALGHNALGEQEKAFGMIHEALDWSIKLESEVLEQLTLRALAELLPIEQRREVLLKSFQLADKNNRAQEKAAVLFTLANIEADPFEAEAQWQAGCEILKKIGAEKWLEGRSIDRPPFIPLLL